MCKRGKPNLVFLLGLLFGAYLALYLKLNQDKPLRRIAATYFPIELPQHDVRNIEYENWFKNQAKTRIKHDIDALRYGGIADETESKFLFDTIDVLCVILVHDDKTSVETAEAASHTWAKGCNNRTSVFLGAKKRKLPSAKYRNHTKWSQLCNVIQRIRLDHVNKAFWVLFVYEQTFVLMENLRLMLASLNHSQGHYIGHTEQFWTVKYNSAEGGYVISYGAIQRLQESFRKAGCKSNILLPNKEDFSLGTKLRELGVVPVDTRDSSNYSTFNLYNWQQEFFPGTNYYRNAVYPRKCCSSRVVTFKGIERDKFYMYYYLLYVLNVFRRGDLGNQPPRLQIDKDFVWKSYLADRGIYRNVSAEEYYKLWEDSALDLEQLQQRIDDNYN